MTKTAATAALTTMIRFASDDQLLYSLIELEARAGLDEAGRLMQTWTVHELFDRHPELDDALDAWLEDLDSPHASQTAVILAHFA